MSTRFNLNRLAYFVATIEEGTITGASDALGVSKAVVSKQLQLLEHEVNTSLLLRNTRRLNPTEAGLSFYEDAKSALTHASNAFERVQELDKKPRGRLRVTAPVDYGVAHVAPFAARFQSLFPDVMVDLNLSDETIDLVQERFDVSFRIGWLKDSSNLARKIQGFKEIPVCTPETLAKAQIENPKDLARVPFVKGQALGPKIEWTFQKGERTQDVSLNMMSEMNITLAIQAFVLHGFAFTILPDFMLQEELDTGRLVHILPEWALREGGVFTVTPPGQVRSNALKRFLEMARSELGLHR